MVGKGPGHGNRGLEQRERNQVLGIPNEETKGGIKMTMETTDTNSLYPNKNISDGKHTFVVEKVVGKQLGGVYGYVWTLEEKGELYEQVLFGNEMKELLGILGFKKGDDGKFHWETEDAKGKPFSVIVSHVPDKKKPDVMRQKFNNYTEELQF
jgi:hypothetical protein